MTITNPRYLLALAAMLAPLLAQGAAPAPLLVCYPGGPVNEQDAKGAMDAMLRVIERVGQWPEHSYTSLFSSKSAECKQLLAENKPDFAITTLGLYLEMRDQYNLVPVVQPKIGGRSGERYRVVVQQGKFQSLDDLKGKSLGGTVLEEPDFIGKIVFGGKFDLAGYFTLKPSKQAIRALRSLDQGEIDAVILNEQQYAGLKSLTLNTPLAAIFTSEEIPLMGLVANNKTSTSGERARFAKALQNMCADTEGKKLCALFGVESFVPAAPEVFDPMVNLWTARK